MNTICSFSYWCKIYSKNMRLMMKWQIVTKNQIYMKMKILFWLFHCGSSSKCLSLRKYIKRTAWSLFLRMSLMKHIHIESTCLFTVTPKPSSSTWFYMFSFIHVFNQHVRLSESVGNTEMRGDVSSFVQKSRSPRPSYNPISHFPPEKIHK